MSEDMNRLKFERTIAKKKVQRNLSREHALALIVNDNIIPIEDLTDYYLDLLGFNMDEDEGGRFIKTLKSQKSSKSVIRGITGFEQFSSDSSEDSNEDSDI